MVPSSHEMAYKIFRDFFKAVIPRNQMVFSGEIAIIDNAEVIETTIFKSKPEDNLYCSKERYFFYQNSFIYNKHLNQTLKKKLDRM